MANARRIFIKKLLVISIGLGIDTAVLFAKNRIGINNKEIQLLDKLI